MNNFGKNIAVWVIISLVLVAIFNVFQGGSTKSQGNVIAYSDFLKRVNSGEVREVSIQGDKIFGASSSGVPFYSFIPKEELIILLLYLKFLVFKIPLKAK